MTPLEIARTKLEFLSSAGDGKAPRTLARSLPKEISDLKLSSEQAKRLALWGAKEPHCLKAAAILNANDIAVKIDADSRAAVETVIDAETRLLALRSRVLARPTTGADADEILENIKLDKQRCSAHWLENMPPVIRQLAKTKDVLTDDKFVAPALIKALEEVSDE